MYAIIEIAGQQFKVEEGKKIFVHKLEAEIESQVEFDRVLLIESGDKITVGTPVIEEALVEAKILDQVRGDKVLVFKKKRRKGYQKLNGHRQYFTQIEITSILEKASGKKRSAPAAKTTVPAAETAAAAEKEVKESVPKKATEKKTAAVKAPAKKAAAETTEKKAPAKKAETTKATEKKAPAKKAETTKATEKKAPAKKAETTKATEKKAPAKKAAPKKKAGDDSGEKKAGKE